MPPKRRKQGDTRPSKRQATAVPATNPETAAILAELRKLSERQDTMAAEAAALRQENQDLRDQLGQGPSLPAPQQPATAAASTTPPVPGTSAEAAPALQLAQQITVRQNLRRSTSCQQPEFVKVHPSNRNMKTTASILVVIVFIVSFEAHEVSAVSTFTRCDPQTINCQPGEVCIAIRLTCMNQGRPCLPLQLCGPASQLCGPAKDTFPEPISIKEYPIKVLEASINGDPCSLPRETGPCKARMPSFYFDFKKEQCRMFTYGGCGGNDNRFETLLACQSACEFRRLRQF